VPLSDTGREQAQGVRHWLTKSAGRERPSAMVSSPYRRAVETAELATEGVGIPLGLDERLRERDLGVFDRLTGRGIRTRYPDEAARRAHLGKFYYRPPSGESWADVVLRVRSFLGDLTTAYDDERVWVVSHQAVIMSFCYVLEDLDEHRVLEASRRRPLPNASFTVFEREGTGYRLDRFGDASHLEETDADVTHEPGKEEAARGR
jgi:broad specificity phosphatase PhoE